MLSPHIEGNNVPFDRLHYALAFVLFDDAYIRFVFTVKLFFGKLDSIKEVTSARCRQAVIYPCSDSFTIQAEGELYDYSNCDSVAAEIVAGKLRFYLPHSD